MKAHSANVGITKVLRLASFAFLCESTTVEDREFVARQPRSLVKPVDVLRNDRYGTRVQSKAMVWFDEALNSDKQTQQRLSTSAFLQQCNTYLRDTKLKGADIN